MMTFYGRLGAAIIFLMGAVLTQASPLFDEDNANFWLLDEQTGRATSFSLKNSEWLQQFIENNQPIYNLGVSQVGLINQLANSSQPLQVNAEGKHLPAVSIAGLGAADYTGADANIDRDFDIYPAAGSYDQTIEVRVEVDESMFEGGQRLSVFWNASLQEKDSVQLTEADINDDGVAVVNFFLARAQVYNLSVEVYALHSDGGIVSLGRKEQTYTINKTPAEERGDSDGDGLPDLVEIAAGLNPLNKDWRFDANGDGWSEFDVWLRGDNPAYLDANGVPRDTDGDGWSDFDEEFIRGTNSQDLITSLPGPLLGRDNASDDDSDAQQRLRRFQDVPAASDLYGVEYRLTANVTAVPTAHRNLRLWGNASVQNLVGETLFGDAQLLTEEELNQLSAPQRDQLPARLLQSNYAQQLGDRQLQGLRIDATDSAVFSLAETHRLELGVLPRLTLEHRQFTQKTWLEQRPNVTPADYTNDSWTTVSEWRAGLIDFLAGQLVQDKTIDVGAAQTETVTLLELLVAQERQFLGTGELFAFNAGFSQAQALAPIQQTLTSRYQRNLDDIVGDIEARAANYLPALTNTINSAYTGLSDGSVYNAVVQRNLLLLLQSDPSAAYRLRLLLLPGLQQAIAENSAVIENALDTDGDNLLNASEVMGPFTGHSLPWLADTDGDGLADDSDPCVALATNTCVETEPLLIVDGSLQAVEPDAGELGYFLLTLQLSKPATTTARVDYAVLSQGQDSAEQGEDYLGVSGTARFAPRQQVAVIKIDLLADNIEEASERFQLQLSSADGLLLAGSQYALVINDQVSELLAGRLVLPMTEGLRYETASVSGITDANGLFSYRSGETIRFYLGNVLLGQVAAKAQLNLFELAGADVLTLPSDIYSAFYSPGPFNAVVNIGTLLYTLDKDANAANGIEIDPGVAALFDSDNLNLALQYADFRTSRPWLNRLVDANTASLFSEHRVATVPWFVMTQLYQGLGIDLPVPVRLEEDKDGDGVVDRTATITHEAGGWRAAHYLDDDADDVDDSRVIYESDAQGNRLDSKTYLDLATRLAYHNVYHFDVNGFATGSSSHYQGDAAFENINRQVKDVWGDILVNETISTTRHSITTFVRDSEGRITSNTLDTDGDGVADQQLTFAYDSDGNKILDIRDHDADGQIDYRFESTWTANGLREGYTEDIDGDGNADRIYRYEYNASGQKTLESRDTDGDGDIDWALHQTYDAAGNNTRYENDYDGDGTADRVIVHTYDALGNRVLTETDTDNDGVIDSRDRFQFTDSANPTLRTRYERDYEADGEVDFIEVSRFNSAGLSIYNGRDNDGDGQPEYITEREYAANGQISREVLDSDGDGEPNRISTARFDSKGNRVESTNDSDGDGVPNYIERWVYSPNGLVTRREYDTNGDGTLDRIKRWTLGQGTPAFWWSMMHQIAIN